MRSTNKKDELKDSENHTIEFVFDDDKLDDEDNSDYFVLRIDPFKLKSAFFSNFIRQYYEQAILKFPQSYEIKIQYANFSLYQMRNMFLCINILKQVDTTKLGFLEKANFKLNEALFLSDIQTQFITKENYQMGYEYDLLGVINFEKVKFRRGRN